MHWCDLSYNEFKHVGMYIKKEGENTRYYLDVFEMKTCSHDMFCYNQEENTLAMEFLARLIHAMVMAKDNTSIPHCIALIQAKFENIALS